MVAFIGTVWATFWLLICIMAYDTSRHKGVDVLIAWIFISLTPIAIYKLLSI